MIKYEITHDGVVARSLIATDPDAEEDMINFMLKLSDEYTGVFTLWRVEMGEYYPENGREKSTQIGASRNGIIKFNEMAKRKGDKK